MSQPTRNLRQAGLLVDRLLVERLLVKKLLLVGRLPVKRLPVKSSREAPHETNSDYRNVSLFVFCASGLVAPFLALLLSVFQSMPNETNSD